MALIWLAVIAVAGLLIFWSLFPTLARIGGILLVVDSVLTLALFPDRAPAAHAVWLLAGIVLWLTGHVVFAVKYGVWRSRLAARIVRASILRRLLPSALR